MDLRVKTLFRVFLLHRKITENSLSLSPKIQIYVSHVICCFTRKFFFVSFLVVSRLFSLRKARRRKKSNDLNRLTAIHAALLMRISDIVELKNFISRFFWANLIKHPEKTFQKTSDSMSEDQEPMDLCECYFSHEFAMRRLLNLVSSTLTAKLVSHDLA